LSDAKIAAAGAKTSRSFHQAPPPYEAEGSFMPLRRFLVLVTLLSASLLPLTQCGCVGEAMQQAKQAAQRQQLMNELKQVGLARFNFHDANGRFPNSWAELQSVGVPAGIQQKLEAEGYTVVFGMKLPEFTAGTSRSMIVFRRDAAQNGGTVLMCDGAVMQITAQEFNDFWRDQEPTMTNAIIIDPPGGTSSPDATGGSAPPPPPPAGS
jgi:hypothetical protein